MNVNVSEKIESKLKDLAIKNGKPVEDFAANLLEEKVKEDFPEIIEDKTEYENPFAPFIGMFASGKTDTSTRYKEILREEIDKRGGFGGS
ncbi:MAG: hypothetical protein LH472_10820 [Pyrinomonadaceae bacterium]|nr:hypothetical protein [Pyrinomonadaceae bacterium]